MEKKDIIDETFDPNRTETYELSIEVSMNGLSYCIKDTVRDLYISLVSYPFERSLSENDDCGDTISQFFAQYDILSKKFKKVHLAFESKLFTLVPNDLFIPEKSKQLFELVHPLPELFEVRYNQIKEINATLIFAIPSSLTAHWKFRQPLTVFIGQATPLIYYSIQNKTKDEPNVFANASDHFYINTISLNNELKFCNSFDAHNTVDTIYHIINSCNLNNIDPSKSQITLNGSFEDAELLEKILSNYFKKVTVDSGYEGHHYSYAIVKYKRTYWNLFNLSKCE